MRVAPATTCVPEWRVPGSGCYGAAPSGVDRAGGAGGLRAAARRRFIGGGRVPRVFHNRILVC